MKVFLASAYPSEWSYVPKFLALAQQDRVRAHEVTDSPDEADLIIHCDARLEHGDWRFRSILNDPIVQQYAMKCCVYNEIDQPWFFMPGVYVSMPNAAFNSQTMAAWSYIRLKNPHVVSSDDSLDGQANKPDLLFSFSGRRCVKVRDRVLEIRHNRGLIEDTSEYNFFGWSDHTAEQINLMRQKYAQTLYRSKFILCPRGSGPASFRLYEALAAGRVPVIISDEWVAPHGPHWETFALRVKEADVASIPAILEGTEAKWESMRLAASAAWKQWFAQDVQFNQIVEACARLKKFTLGQLQWNARTNRRKLWFELREVRAALRKLTR